MLINSEQGKNQDYTQIAFSSIIDLAIQNTRVKTIITAEAAAIGQSEDRLHRLIGFYPLLMTPVNSCALANLHNLVKDHPLVQLY